MISLPKKIKDIACCINRLQWKDSNEAFNNVPSAKSSHSCKDSNEAFNNVPSAKSFNFNFQYFIEHLKFKRMGLKALKLIESLLPRKLTECTSNYEYQSSRSHKN